jgi:hypothetical protein
LSGVAELRRFMESFQELPAAAGQFGLSESDDPIQSWSKDSLGRFRELARG